MKKFLIMTCLFLNFLSYSQAADADKSYTNKVTNILVELEKLIASGDQKDAVSQTFLYIKEKLFTNKLSINISKKTKGILYGSTFDIDMNNNAFITMNTDMIDVFQDRPSIVFSIIIHEMKHAYDYFTIENYSKYMEDEIENYMYEMDSIFIEGMFICNYLLKNNYKLGKFEKFLFDSYSNDKLSGASAMLKQIDSDSLHIFYFMREKYYNDKLILKNFLDMIKDEGNKLIKVKDEINNNEWNKYFYLLKLNTFQYYLPLIINNIVFKNDNDRDLFIANTEELNKLLINMRNILSQDNQFKFIADFRQKFMESLEN